MPNVTVDWWVQVLCVSGTESISADAIWLSGADPVRLSL
jgi:hypothetical protein